MDPLRCVRCGGTGFAQPQPARRPKKGAAAVALRCTACGKLAPIPLDPGKRPRSTARATREDADIAERETDHQAALDEALEHDRGTARERHFCPDCDRAVITCRHDTARSD